MLKLIINNKEVEKKTEERETIKKVVGVTEDGTILMVDCLHWNGVSVNEFVPITQDEINDRNDVDNIKDSYDYLWHSAVAAGDTEEGLVEYLEGIIEAEVNYGGKYFFGQDDSYIYDITKEDQKLIEEHFEDIEIETYECIGGGTVHFGETKMKVIFDQGLWDRAVEHCLSKRRTKLTAI